MQCDKFRSRSGSIHILTEHQYRAAKSANVLNIIQYTHMGSVGSTPAVKPTQTDAEFFSEHLKDYSFPHVGLLHPGRRGRQFLRGIESCARDVERGDHHRRMRRRRVDP
jgi:hypothetical protein